MTHTDDSSTQDVITQMFVLCHTGTPVAVFVGLQAAKQHAEQHYSGHHEWHVSGSDTWSSHAGSEHAGSESVLSIHLVPIDAAHLVEATA